MYWTSTLIFICHISANAAGWFWSRPKPVEVTFELNSDQYDPKGLGAIARLVFKAKEETDPPDTYILWDYTKTIKQQAIKVLPRHFTQMALKSTPINNAT